MSFEVDSVDWPVGAVTFLIVAAASTDKKA